MYIQLKADRTNFHTWSWSSLEQMGFLGCWGWRPYNNLKVTNKISASIYVFNADMCYVIEFCYALECIGDDILEKREMYNSV